MADTDDDNSTESPLKITLPTVLCTPEPPDDDILLRSSSFVSSESKLSLPSNLGTPTSPLKLSSPLSLPASPSPFMKITQTDVIRNPDSPQRLSSGQQNSAKLVNTGSATGMFLVNLFINTGSATGIFLVNLFINRGSRDFICCIVVKGFCIS
ncbi:hypothetical protein ACJJTC_005884 [Scirpophaga incertulas]